MLIELTFIKVDLLNCFINPSIFIVENVKWADKVIVVDIIVIVIHIG
jgi:hypothetical protein